MIRKLLSKKPTYPDPAAQHHGSEFEVNNWIISDFVARRLVPVVGFHPFPLNELMLMTAAVCHFKPQLIFEWGTNIGKSARIFYEAAEAFSVPCEIHSIDLPDHVFHNEHPRSDRGIMVRNINKVTLHQADGLTKSLELIEQKKPDGNVLFFVDGDHSYESVKKELEGILSKVPGAAALLHDTFYQSEEAGYNTGPYRAINEVMQARASGYKRVSTNMGLPGMTLIFPATKK